MGPCQWMGLTLAGQLWRLQKLCPTPPNYLRDGLACEQHSNRLTATFGTTLFSVRLFTDLLQRSLMSKLRLRLTDYPFNHLECIWTLGLSKPRLWGCLEIAVGANSLGKLALFSGPRCLSLLRYFEHAKVVSRWKMLVTLTLFSRWTYSLKMVNFTKNTLQVVKRSATGISQNTILCDYGLILQCLRPSDIYCRTL